MKNLIMTVAFVIVALVIFYLHVKKIEKENRTGYIAKVPPEPQMRETIEVFADSVTRENPGKSWIAVIISKCGSTESKRKVILEKASFISTSTMNQAAYAAIEQGLKMLSELSEVSYKVPAAISVYSTNEIVISQINGGYPVRDQKLLMAKGRIISLIEKFKSDGSTVEIVECGSGNSPARSLCVEAMKANLS